MHHFGLFGQVEELYTKIRKTHNQGVFDAYTAEMRAARKSGILTGLPDGYGRGRIIGDYRYRNHCIRVVGTSGFWVHALCKLHSRR